MSRYIDPTTDFGFKKLFGEEVNKELTLSFINDVLALDIPLLEISFSHGERLPETAEERRGIYDVVCQDAAGSYFLVEMQKHRILFIRDRMLYYSTFPIVEQAKKGKHKRYAYPAPPPLPPGVLAIRDAPSLVDGEPVVATAWNYKLTAIYCIAVLGYTLYGSTRAVNYNSIRNDEPPYELFYDKLRFVTVELPLFDERKPEYSLDRHLNKWLYFLKYLPELDVMPKPFKNDPIFRKAFRIAELANLTSKERHEYEINVKYMRDHYAVIMTSYNDGMSKGITDGMAKGMAKGIAEGKAEGKLEKGRDTIQLVFSQKLGPIPPDIAGAINTLNDEKQIDEILAHFVTINDWETLLNYLK